MSSIKIQHRIVYQVLENDKTVKVLRMWIHYTDLAAGMV